MLRCRAQTDGMLRRLAGSGSRSSAVRCCGAATAAARPSYQEPGSHGATGKPIAAGMTADPVLKAPAMPGLRKLRPEVGGAVLGVEEVMGKSTIVKAAWSSPMRLLMPKNAAAVGCAPAPALGADTAPAKGANWVYSVTYGGGLVSGDVVSVEASIGAGCTTILATQSSTKVYGPHQIWECPAEDGVTRQKLSATVGDGVSTPAAHNRSSISIGMF